MTTDMELAQLSAVALCASCAEDEAAFLRRFAVMPPALRDNGDHCSAALVAAAAGWSLPDTTRFLSRLTRAGLLDVGTRGYALRPVLASLILERMFDDLTPTQRGLALASGIATQSPHLMPTYA